MENGMAEKKEADGSVEKGKRNRGLGILALCMLLAAVGIWKFSPSVISASSRVGSRELPICSAENAENQIALSFECVDDKEYTQEILKILERQEVKATFFVSSEWAERYPREVRQIQSLGHELGNSGSGRGSMEQLSRKKYRDCILQTEKQLKELTGIETELFRPPLGKYGNQTIKTVADMGYYPICWSVDSMDWKDYGADSIIQRVRAAGPESGDIIRFQNDAKYTAKALEPLIVELKEKGFEMVPVGELILRENYEMDETGKQFSIGE